MKAIFFIILIVCTYCLIAPFVFYKTYIVKITYCDKRPADTFVTKNDVPPCNDEIETHNEAVPKWHNELNVCAVETLKQVQ